MNYIKAKFPSSTRSYTYCTEDSVKAGDMVVNAKGAKLTVTDESVDMKWVEIYGADKVAVVSKFEEVHHKVDVHSLDEETQCKYCRYNDSCSGNGVTSGAEGEPIFPACSELELEDWFDEESYLSDLKESEESEND